MGALDYIKSGANKVANATPIVSNVKGVVTGDKGLAIGGAATGIGREVGVSDKYTVGAQGAIGGFALGGPAGAVKGATLGYTVGSLTDAERESKAASAKAAADAAKGTPAEASLRAFADQLAAERATLAAAPRTVPKIDAAGSAFPTAAVTPTQTVARPGDISAPPPVTAQTVGAQEMGHQEALRAQQVGAQRINAPTTVGASLLLPADQVRAQQIAATKIGPSGQVTANAVNAERVNAMALQGVPADIQAERLARAQLDGTREQQARDAQSRGLGLVERAAMGDGPSAAEALLRKGIDENIGAQLGMAATLQGNNAGLALRSGLAGAQGAIAKSAADMAALRAGEQATARQQLLAGASDIRGTDIDFAGRQLAADVDIGRANQSTGLSAAQSNQGVRMQAAVTNLQSALDTAKTNAANALAAGQTNAANALQAQTTNIQTALESAKANQAAELEAARSNQATDLSANLANQGANLDVNKTDSANRLQAGIASMQAGVDVAKANASNDLSGQQANAANTLSADTATMNARLDTMKANQAALLRAGEVNAANDLQAQINNLDASIKVATANQGANLQAGLKDADLAAAAGQFNAEQTNRMAVTDAERKRAIDEANQRAELAARGMDDAKLAGATSALLDARKAPLDVEQKNIDRAIREAEARRAQQASYIDSLSKTLGAVSGADWDKLGAIVKPAAKAPIVTPYDHEEDERNKG